MLIGRSGGRAGRLGIFVGFASFFIMEKTLRVLGGEDEGEGHSHSHSHSHSSNGSAEHANGHSTAVKAPSADGLKSRGADANSDSAEKHESNGNSNGNGAAEDAPKQTSKLSAYLNLFGDFVHNMSVPSSPQLPAPDDTPPRVRLLAKFVENSYEKPEKLLEIRDSARARLKATEKDIEDEKKVHSTSKFVTTRLTAAPF